MSSTTSSRPSSDPGVIFDCPSPNWIEAGEPGGVNCTRRVFSVGLKSNDDADQLLSRFSHETIRYRRPDGRPCPAAERPMLLPRATGRTVRDLDWFFRRDGSMLPLHALWLRSTHMGCLLRFNGAERSWDCPCHGSRFDVDGTVRSAVAPLERSDP